MARKSENEHRRRARALGDMEYSRLEAETCVLVSRSVFRGVEGNCLLSIPSIREGVLTSVSVRLSVAQPLQKSTIRVFSHRGQDLGLFADLSVLQAGEKLTLSGSVDKHLTRFLPQLLVEVLAPMKTDLEVEFVFEPESESRWRKTAE